jgi:hypothetical protein
MWWCASAQAPPDRAAPGHRENAGLALISAHLPGDVMISQQWRARLAYAAMSVFLAWHTAAIIIAPVPEYSALIQTLRVPFQPYMSLFRLDNMWDFFAPNVDSPSELRYIVEDAGGNQHPFAPAKDLTWFHPYFFWSNSWYNSIMDEPEMYADAAGEIFCHRHASLQPVSIFFLEAESNDFTPRDELAGKHPMDPEFVTVNTLRLVACPGF